MAGTDITNLLDIVQRKINAVDSSASTGDLLYLLSAIRQSGEGSVFAYDNESQIPNLLDGTPDPEMIAYTLDSDKLYFQRGSWVGKQLPPIPPFQGSNFGYASGGTDGSSVYNVIDKFPFASDGNATDVGDLTVGRYGPAGQSSQTHGYTSGGGTPSSTNVIDKFTFSTDANATDVGDLTLGRHLVAGQSSIANGFGYTTASAWSNTEVIDKFPFSTDANATDVGDLTVARRSVAGQSSTTHGYTSGGAVPTVPRARNVIDKFSFTTDGDATDVGDLTVGRYSVAGQSSTTHGYSSAGYTTLRIDIIDKFPFSADGNATDVGDLTAGNAMPGGQSSTTHGYTSGGTTGGHLGGGSGTGVPSNVIDKFPFSTDANATDVGDLTVARYDAAGQQY